MDKIVLEEHFVIPDFLDYLANAMPRVTKDEYDRVVAMLSDFGERRLSAMDGAGVRLAVLSMTGSGVQLNATRNLPSRERDRLTTPLPPRPLAGPIVTRALPILPCGTSRLRLPSFSVACASSDSRER